MENLLEKLLKKAGVKDYRELTTQEKATYDNWSKVLSKEVNIDDIEEFIGNEVKKLYKELKEKTKKDKGREALYLTARIDNYEAILSIIKTPKAQKEAIKERIKKL